MAKKYFCRKIKTAIFIFLFLFFSPSFCFATTIISPLLDFVADTGQSQKGVVKIFNETKENLFLKASIEVFNTSGEEGSPVYLPESEKNDYLNWFKLEQDSILLKPNQIAIVPFEIDIPKEALPGGYYAVIFWETMPEDNENPAQLNIKSKVGTLIFLKVNGDIKEQAEILDFLIYPPKKYYSDFPLNFAARISNSGNVHLRPTIELEIRNKFGFSKTFKMNDGGKYILPGSVRRFELVWGEKNKTKDFFSGFLFGLKNEINNKSLGKHTAILSVNFGAENKIFTKNVDFWFFPWRLGISTLAVLIIFVIFILINLKVNKLKKKARIKSYADKS